MTPSRKATLEEHVQLVRQLRISEASKDQANVLLEQARRFGEQEKEKNYQMAEVENKMRLCASLKHHILACFISVYVPPTKAPDPFRLWIKCAWKIESSLGFCSSCTYGLRILTPSNNSGELRTKR